MPTQIPDDVKQVLQRSIIAADHLSLPAQLDRKLYVKTDEVMRSLGIVWNKKRKVHVFEKPDAAAKLQEALGAGVFTNEKKEFEVFETPEAVAEELACRIVKRGHIVLEPSAGSGRLVTAALQAGAQSILAVDVRPEAVDQLERLQSKFPKQNVLVEQKDFLQFDTQVRFDSILMNPPFSRLTDVDHVTHALKFLRPGGNLISIMAPGWQTSTTKKAKAFRLLVNPITVSCDNLPEGTFKQEGTCVRTVVLHLWNPR